MSSIKRMLSRKSLLPILASAIFVLLSTTIWALWTGDSRVSGLSTVAACLSGLGALLVSVRTQWLDQARRENERSESDLKRAKTRKDVSAVYSEQVSTWRRRKDVGDFLKEISSAWSKEDLMMHPFAVALSARDSITKTSGSEAIPESLSGTIVETSKDVCSRLALDAFPQFSDIPSIWTSLFRREDIDFLGDDAPIFFIKMSGLWTNFTLMVKQVPPTDTALRFLESHSAAYSKEYLARLADYIAEVRSLFEEFLKLADRCAELLRRPDAEDPLKELEIANELIVRSANASPRLTELEREIAFERAVKKVKPASDALLKVSQNAQDTVKELGQSGQSNAQSEDVALSSVKKE
jgi:hypothetical protein